MPAAALIAGCWIPPGDVTPPPTPHLSASASTAVVGESVTLTATGAAQLPTSLPPVTYTWNLTGPDGHQIRLDEGNSSTYLAHPTVPGTYTYEVDITDNAGDHRPSNTVQVTFTPPTSTPTS